jgi:hypothetical protein
VGLVNANKELSAADPSELSNSKKKLHSVFVTPVRGMLIGVE